MEIFLMIPIMMKNKTTMKMVLKELKSSLPTVKELLIQ